MEKVTSVLTFENTNLFVSEPEVLSSLFNWFTEAYRIHFSKVNFVWNGSSFIPLSGDYNILGKEIEIKQYAWVEFMELIRDTKTTLYFATKLEKNIDRLDKYFSVEYISKVDYPSTISHLETLGFVKTKESESFIATDPRVFSIVNFDDYDASNLWYEVDILGTPYGNEITNNVVELFDKYKQKIQTFCESTTVNKKIY